jgi:hypothetical protein
MISPEKRKRCCPNNLTVSIGLLSCEEPKFGENIESRTMQLLLEQDQGYNKRFAMKKLDERYSVHSGGLHD